MSAKNYLPRGDAEKAIWLANFVEKAKLYQVALGLSPATIVQLENDRDTFAVALVLVEQVRTCLEGLTAFKNRLRESKEPLGAVPTLPTIPPVPPAVLGDIFGRVRLLVKTIKLNPNYTETIGDELGIIGEEEGAIDPSTLKPLLQLRITTGGHPEVVWHKGQTSGVKIKVDRGTGFEFLATDTHPNYTDTHALPPFGQSAVWKYTAIFLLGDEEAGQWSDPMSITVSGQP